MTTDHPLDLGRSSYGRQSWGHAYAQLSKADAQEPLEPEDLMRLARAAQLTGQDADADDVWERAHRECIQRRDHARAVRCAFWLGMSLLQRGDMARAGGWLARAQRLTDESGLEGVEGGFLLIPMALQAMYSGDPTTAYETFSRIVEIAEPFGDADLTTLGRLGKGQALAQLGRAAEAVVLLDDAMVSVSTREVDPIVAGIVYCGVIEACQQIFDLRRAREWTEALTKWCDSQPDLVPFRGQCLVHRAEITRMRGAWAEALEEAQRAYERLAEPPGQPAIGAAVYQKAELHRLRGEFVHAEQAYRQASQLGREPHPGLAQLRLAQGQLDAAAAAIRRVVNEVQDRVERSAVLAAYVEIMLAVRDIDAARVAEKELGELAAGSPASLVEALAAHAKGAILLADGDARAAVASLRSAWTVWQDLDAPYQAAQARALIGLACRELGDADTGEMELDAARCVFERLGAAPDLARLDQLEGPGVPKATGGLTGRELEVLQLVATGQTNREIAGALSISEKTVGRHISNIFGKIDVSSRSAATAYAFTHGLV